MKNKSFKLYALLFYSLGFTGLQGQNMHIQRNAGTENIYPINSLRKMTFESSNLSIIRSNNSSSEYSLSDLQHIKFKHQITSLENYDREIVKVQVYPNPVSDVLNLKLPADGSIEILSLDGKVLESFQVNAAGIVTFVTNKLAEGIYICKYNNGKEVQTVKIIKQ